MTRINDFVAGRMPPELYETYLSPGVFIPWADDLIAPAPDGGAFLDIACGTGVVARTLAKRHSSVPAIAAIDVAPPMIAAANAIANAQGVKDRITFEIASADSLPFDDDRFDAVFCQQGMQFFPDKVQALREARRVLKPGGVLSAAVWTAAGDGNPVFDAFEKAVARTLGADLVPFGPFSFGDGDALRTVVEDAGFGIRTFERREKVAALPGVEALVLFDVLFLGRPGADGALQPVIDPNDPGSDAIVETLIADMTAALGDFIQRDGSLKAPMTAHLVVAEA